MANSTVYPYGVEGKLPTSIGLVNDLFTGGSDKALTAEQGKVIGAYLFSQYIPVDLSEIQISDYSLGASKKWISGGKHMVIPVTPGDRIRVTVSSTQTTGGWYGFLSNSYVVPALSDTIPFVSGRDRVWLNNGFTELIVPNETSYLCICPKDGIAKDSSWEVSKYYAAEISPELHYKVNVPDIVASDNTLLGSKKWGKGTYGGKHIVVPVEPFMKCKVSLTTTIVHGTANGNFYGFLTSSYTVPSSGSTTPYCSETDRVWVDDGSDLILIAPGDAAYLCLVVENGSGDTTVWEVDLYTEASVKEAFESMLGKGDVVNNLSDGGIDIPLSAEQGKVLDEKYGDPIPQGLTKHSYFGPRYKFTQERKVAYSTIMTLSNNTGPQGGACFGDWFFQFTTNNAVVRIYNLSSNNLVQSVELSSEDKGFVSNCHCNSVCFGEEYYNIEDEFPLIYVSTGYSSGGYTGCLVYRIQKTESNDTYSFSFTLVQTIKFPGTGWTEFVTAGEMLLVVSGRIVYRFAMPLLSDGDIILDTANSLQEYKNPSYPASYNGSRPQGHLYYNGKLFIASGVPSAEKSMLVVLNLALGIRECVIDFTEIGLTTESEAVFIWQDHLCIAFTNKIVMFYFD